MIKCMHKLNLLYWYFNIQTFSDRWARPWSFRWGWVTAIWSRWNHPESGRHGPPVRWPRSGRPCSYISPWWPRSWPFVSTSRWPWPTSGSPWWPTPWPRPSPATTSRWRTTTWSTTDWRSSSIGRTWAWTSGAWTYWTPPWRKVSSVVAKAPVIKPSSSIFIPTKLFRYWWFHQNQWLTDSVAF